MKDARAAGWDGRSTALVLLLMAIVGLLPFGLRAYSRTGDRRNPDADVSRISTDLLLGTAPQTGVFPQETPPAPATPLKPGEKLTMIDFYTDWCGFCKEMDRNVYSRGDVQAALQRDFVVRKLNPETDKEGAELAQRLGVTAYPTMVFLGAQGQEVYRINGYRDGEEFLAELAAARKAAGQVSPDASPVPMPAPSGGST